MPNLEIDRASFAQVIRKQTAPAIGAAEADALARTLETAQSDDEFLANTLVALRLIADRLTDATDQRLSAGSCHTVSCDGEATK